MIGCCGMVRIRITAVIRMRIIAVIRMRITAVIWMRITAAIIAYCTEHYDTGLCGYSGEDEGTADRGGTAH